jgi:antirestriction protein ArdC
MATSITRDVYQQVTDQIIAAMEAGAGTWQMPWHRGGTAHGRPVNVLTGNAYRGVNILSLWASGEARGFGTSTWGTYRQWQEKGAQVRKGEKSSLVVFYKQFDVEQSGSAEGDDNQGGTRMFARASWVFNADQVDGWTTPVSEIVSNPVERIERAERLVAQSGAVIRHGGDRAYFSPSTDHVQMPDMFSFTGTSTSTATECYYGTLLHELTHWSGSSKRLERTFGKRFGDDAYAMEELVAELGAAFLCSSLGISPVVRPDHAAYIDHWLRVLKGDKRAIFTAASKASQAADYLAAFETQVREAAA